VLGIDVDRVSHPVEISRHSRGMRSGNCQRPNLDHELRGPFHDQPVLFSQRQDARRRQFHFDHSSRQFYRIKSQPNQIEYLHRIQCRGRWTDALLAPSAPIQPEAKCEPGERLASDDQRLE
jgi:hypothetical protein